MSEDSNVARAKTLLEQNPEGLTASQMAVSLGLVAEGAPAAEMSKACKKARVIARKAIGSKSNAKNGRNAVYKIAPVATA